MQWVFNWSRSSLKTVANVSNDGGPTLEEVIDSMISELLHD